MILGPLLATSMAVTDIDPTDDAETRVAAAPRRVSAFVARRAGCNHFLGEEPYDRERAAQLEKALRQLRCDRIDADQQRLRMAYAGDHAILQRLDEMKDSLGW